MTRSTPFSAPFLRLYGLALLFFSANSILNVIIPLRSDELGASNGQIGFIMGAYMLACMVFRPWAGSLIYKHRPIVILRLLLVVNGLALVLYTFTGLEGYFAARVLQGICTAFFSMALQLGMIDELPEEERSRGLSLYSLFTYLPTVIGPLAAIGIWEWGGSGGFAASMAGIAVVTALFGFQAPLKGAPSKKNGEKHAGMGRALLAGATHRPFLLCGTLMLLLSIVFGAVTAFVPLYARAVEYGHAGYYLMIQAAVIVAARFALAGRIPSDGLWHGRYIGFVCLTGAGGAGLLAMAGEVGPLAFYAAPLFIGAAQALLYPTLTSYLTFVLPKAHRNVLIGFFIATADLGISLGGMAMGPIADGLSYSVMYGVCALLALKAMVLAFTIMGRGRARRLPA